MIGPALKGCAVHTDCDSECCGNIKVSINLENVDVNALGLYTLGELRKSSSKEDLEKVFDGDFDTACSNANQLIKDLPLHHQAKCVLIEMVFQLGIGGVSKFKNMWKALGEGDYQTASEEMLDSRWAKQTPKRATDLSNVMKSCKI